MDTNSTIRLYVEGDKDENAEVISLVKSHAKRVGKGFKVHQLRKGLYKLPLVFASDRREFRGIAQIRQFINQEEKELASQ